MLPPTINRNLRITDRNHEVIEDAEFTEVDDRMTRSEQGRRIISGAGKLLLGGFGVVVLIGLMAGGASDESGTVAEPMESSASISEIDGLEHPTRYSLRSKVTGASLVRLDELPSVTPYGDASDDYCGKPEQAKTAGGRFAEQSGWRVIKEVRLREFDAVLLVRGYDPGTSGHCFSKDPNLAFFKGDRLVGVLYSKGENGIGINDVTNVGGHLRIWDDLTAVGQVSLSGHDLTFEPITGIDEVCQGAYRVPVVFGQDYSKARRILGSAGWIARPSTEDTSQDDRTADYRSRFPEVDSCSGTGYAYCSFGLNAQGGIARLSITTAGEEADPVVINYDVSCDGGHAQ
jgi:hypothetical protein